MNFQEDRQIEINIIRNLSTELNYDYNNMPVIKDNRLYKNITKYILDDLTISLELNQPGILEFSMKTPNNFYIAQGDDIECLKPKTDTQEFEKYFFVGKVFSIKYLKNDTIKITAYDHLKYFANKHVMYIPPNTYTINTLFNTLCDQLQLEHAIQSALGLGNQRENIYLPESFEDDKTMFDILNSAINYIYKQTGKVFIYRSKAGILSIEDIQYMGNWTFEYGTIDTFAQDFEYTSSIADGVYNRVVYYKDDYKTAGSNFFKRQMDDKTEDTDKDGKIDHYETVSSWGVLQYTEKIDDKTINVDNDMRTFLRTHNKPKRTLKIKDMITTNYYLPGHWIVFDDIIFGSVKLKGQALINKVKLKIKKKLMYVDLSIMGGDFG